MRLLFIGGCCDGQWHEVPDTLRHRAVWNQRAPLPPLAVPVTPETFEADAYLTYNVDSYVVGEYWYRGEGHWESQRRLRFMYLLGKNELWALQRLMVGYEAGLGRVDAAVKKVLGDQQAMAALMLSLSSSDPRSGPHAFAHVLRRELLGALLGDDR